ncbi:hypothetical protein [Allosalinactinospora lopnorensis]|uniref:hypothetical protein n=1 Tax=Allosalinactinospora lopnorensis TaxID=1352348 RepID=UPI000623DF9E|nr:hypothetical protein [Allosalinactinospora lopnorensis]
MTDVLAKPRSGVCRVALLSRPVPVIALLPLLGAATAIETPTGALTTGGTKVAISPALSRAATIALLAPSPIPGLATAPTAITPLITVSGAEPTTT